MSDPAVYYIKNSIESFIFPLLKLLQFFFADFPNRWCVVHLKTYILDYDYIALLTKR